MKIEGHRLVGDETVTVKHRNEKGGAPQTPEVIVIHYGVTENLEQLINFQRYQEYWAHVSIDGSSEIGHQAIQTLPFNVTGIHAGKSKWRGRSSVNRFSIGIEISNPGPLIRGRDGQLRTVRKTVWPEEDAIEAQHKIGPLGDRNGKWTHWAKYSDQEIDICIEMSRLLKETYPSIVDVVGHDDISPGRKFDPGPAFPLEYVRDKVFGS